jgi:NAD(P)H-flavin reductase
MKHISCTVAATAAAFGARRIVTLSAPDLPRMRAGQLVLARVNDTLDPYLPAAYFPLPAGATPQVLRAAVHAAGVGVPAGATPQVLRAAVHAAGVGVPARTGELALLVEADDPLGRSDAVGETLELIAPVGNGFALDPATRRLLLVAAAARLAPLIALAHEASQKQIAVSLLVHSADVRHGAQDDADLAAWLSEMLPLDVEYQVAAELSAVLPGLVGWADQLCAAGDAELYALLKGSAGLEGRMRAVGGRPHGSRTTARDTGSVLPAGFAQVIVAPLMACGFGACQGCAVETARGMRLACVDGPVFDLGEL